MYPDRYNAINQIFHILIIKEKHYYFILFWEAKLINTQVLDLSLYSGITLCSADGTMQSYAIDRRE